MASKSEGGSEMMVTDSAVVGVLRHLEFLDLLAESSGGSQILREKGMHEWSARGGGEE